MLDVLFSSIKFAFFIKFECVGLGFTSAVRNSLGLIYPNCCP